MVDLGCGPGIMAQEIATLKSCVVHGYDQDAGVLNLAQSINRLFDNAQRVKFRLAEISQGGGSDKANAACVRFVAQYTDDLTAFMAQVKSWVTPGGFIAVEDVDDGYLVEYPQPPAAWRSAIEAFQQFQSGPRGDRQVGRKLAQAGVAAGLTLSQISVNAAVQAETTSPDSMTVQFDIERIEQALPGMIQAGLITERQWYEARSQYRASFPAFVFTSAATIRLLFQVP